MKPYIIFLVCILHFSALADYILVPVKINGKETKLIFDTGASISVLSQKFCDEIGIKYKLKKQNIYSGETTELCSVEIFGRQSKTRFAINDNLNLLNHADIAGILSFNDVRDNILYLNADKKQAGLVDKLPLDIKSWSCKNLEAYQGIPSFKAGDEHFILDTGCSGGFHLRAKLRKSFIDNEFKEKLWKITWGPGVGGSLNCTKVSWVDKLKIGSLTISDSPIEHSFLDLPFVDHFNVIGLFGMTRFEFYLDSSAGKIYFRPVIKPQTYYPDLNGGLALEGAEKVTCKVQKGSPAEKAGLRDGDVIQDFDFDDITAGRSINLNKFSVLRGSKIIEVEIDPKPAFSQGENLKKTVPFNLTSKKKSPKLSFSKKPNNDEQILKLAKRGNLSEYEELVLFNFLKKEIRDNADIDKNILVQLIINEFKHNDSLRLTLIGLFYLHVEKNEPLGLKCLIDASRTSAKAMFALGLYYSTGVGEKQTSIFWLKKAAENGHLYAHTMLYTIYSMGIGVEEDLPEALKWVKAGASGGDPLCQHILTECYYFGIDGVSKNYKEAFKWAKLASLKGRNCCCRLGYMYKHGKGVKQNYKKAVYWYRKAVAVSPEDGLVLFNLGTLYMLGKGVEKDTAKGLGYLEKAAKLGDEDALYGLGLLYIKGQEVKKDTAKGLSYLEKAAKVGDEKALYYLGLLYIKGQEVKKDTAKGLSYLKTVAKLGDEDALYGLGLLYIKGQGVKKDTAKGLGYLKKAAKLGSAEASLVVGNLYFTGTYVPKNYEKAFQYYLKAAYKGNAKAFYYLGIFHHRGLYVTKDLDKAERLYKKAADKGIAEAEDKLFFIQLDKK